MDYTRDTVQRHENVWVDYDRAIYKDARKRRWNVFKDEPMANAADMCYVLRKIVNLDSRRLDAVIDICRTHPRVIVFYNFDDELEALRNLTYISGTKIAEWTGHKHEAVPDSKRWVYLVQYSAGAEGWNCITTDTIIFFSQNYSYKVMVQAAGRIDRMTTPYKILWYYHLKSHSDIDLAIARALNNKRKFNERKFTKWDG
jgi:superfamily II DNA or RNA helicase